MDELESMINIITDIQGNRTQAEFAKIIGVSEAAVSLYKSGQRHPNTDTVAALLRIADPPQQCALLKTLGIEDVEQFAADLLASAGVKLIGGDGKRALLAKEPK